MDSCLKTRNWTASRASIKDADAAAAVGVKLLARPSVRSMRREVGAGKPQVIVDVAAPANVSVDLFAEGPTPQWALPVPETVKDAPAGLRRFAFEIDGVPPGASDHGALLTLTAVASGQAIEVEARLD